MPDRLLRGPHRRASCLALLVFYLAALVLLSIGHQCGSLEDASGGVHRSASGKVLAGASPHAGFPAHTCLACTWQRAMTPAFALHGQGVVLSLQAYSPTHSPVPLLPNRLPPTHPTRGPPIL